MQSNILFIGDVVGKPGIEAVEKVLPELIKEYNLDFVISNAENVSGGTGITPKSANKLFDLGVDCITSGDHVWKRPEVLEIINDQRLVRPLNLPKVAPGKGFTIIKKEGGLKLAVINLQGRVFMPPIDCPFNAIKENLEQIRNETKMIIVDMHAEATSEKISLGYFLDGLVSAVLGTHTHVQTADEKILPQGTAYITDVGMVGASDSVIGRRKEKIIERFLTGMPTRFELASEKLLVCGVVVSIDRESGVATKIQRVQRSIKEE